MGAAGRRTRPRRPVAGGPAARRTRPGTGGGGDDAVDARRRDRRCRIGQDQGAHDADRPPHRHRHGRRPPHARADVHPRGGGRAAPPAAPQPGCATTSRPARSTPSPSTSCASAGPTSTGARRRSWATGSGCSPRSPAACRWPRWRRRPTGPRPGRSRPTATSPRPATAGRRGRDAARPHRHGAGRLRDAQAPARRRRPRRPARRSRHANWSATRRGRTPCASATATWWSTRPRTSTRCSTACSTSSSAGATTCTSSVTRRRRSTGSTARIRACCGTSPHGCPGSR